MTNQRTIGLVSDVHGNLPALREVLIDMPEVDVLVNAGDVIGYGPQPEECATILREKSDVSVLGNHDETLRTEDFYEPGDRYAYDVLSDENRRWIEDLPRKENVIDDRVKVAHGDPSGGFEYVRPGRFREDLLGDEDVLVLGHTHVQAKKETASGTIVNPGSVGQPRDGDPDAAYAVLEVPSNEVSLNRVEYDIEEVEEAARETRVSGRVASRLRKGR
jgi:putative phosphoesterase